MDSPLPQKFPQELREADGSGERSLAGRVSVGSRGPPGRGHMATDRE